MESVNRLISTSTSPIPDSRFPIPYVLKILGAAGGGAQRTVSGARCGPQARRGPPAVMQRRVGLRARVLVGGPSPARAGPGERKRGRVATRTGPATLMAEGVCGGLLARATMADVPCWQKLGDARSDSRAPALRRWPRRESGGGGPGGASHHARARAESEWCAAAAVWSTSSEHTRLWFG